MGGDSDGSAHRSFMGDSCEQMASLKAMVNSGLGILIIGSEPIYLPSGGVFALLRINIMVVPP